MGKSLSDRIAERNAAAGKGSQAGSPSVQNKAIVLLLRDEISKAVQDGWPVKAIWETLRDEGRVPFSYQSFRLLVKKLIVPTKAAEGPDTAEPAAEARKQNAQQPPSTRITPATGFTFNAAAKKEDLL